ncbi:hypothetical protein [Lusitaniella coriacea]|uniref:hypothetical protein n=1 Tax=Lusitaniella coriacea TaxID=1983105 RepID=UPI001881794C|nr:hypothetical protein [Lusitaniella coriacea]
MAVIFEFSRSRSISPLISLSVTPGGIVLLGSAFYTKNPTLQRRRFGTRSRQFETLDQFWAQALRPYCRKTRSRRTYFIMQ